MKKGDCVLCKYEIPRSDSTSAHSDQDFHCLSMYEGESVKNQPNLFLGEIDLFFFDVIAL